MMGFLSVWIPKTENIYIKVRNIANFFEPCGAFVTSIWNMVDETVESRETDALKIAENAKIKENLQTKIIETQKKLESLEKKDEETKPEEVKKTCEKTKKILEKIWLKCVDNMYENKTKKF